MPETKPDTWNRGRGKRSPTCINLNGDIAAQFAINRAIQEGQTLGQARRGWAIKVAKEAGEDVPDDAEIVPAHWVGPARSAFGIVSLRDAMDAVRNGEM